MAPLLPDELLLSLSDRWPCRDAQIRQIAALLPFRGSGSAQAPSPATIVVHGPSATGKSAVVRSFLETARLRHAVVQCRECVTGRHLLERATSVVHQAVREHDGTTIPGPDRVGRTENLAALAVNLEYLLRGQRQFVLVLDGIDNQREAAPTLLPALSRLGETIPQLTILLIVQFPAPRFLHQAGVPHIHFPPYTRVQTLHIVAREPPDIFLVMPTEEYDATVHAEDKAWLWPRFCSAVWDALGAQAARDLSSFRTLCHRLWRPFLIPVVKGEFGTRDFTRLLVSQRRLFQDESVLLDSLISPEDVDHSGLNNDKEPTTPYPTTQHVMRSQFRPDDLPYFAKWLLVAAYLASFNPARFDAQYFMKMSERNRNSRKRRGGARAPSTPSRRGTNTPSKRPVARHLLAPSAVPLDRLLAILHAILPHDLRSACDIYRQITTLASLRLLVRAGGMGAGSLGSTDFLEPGAKWRVGAPVSWEYVQSMARSVGFEVGDYIVE